VTNSQPRSLHSRFFAADFALSRRRCSTEDWIRQYATADPPVPHRRPRLAPSSSLRDSSLIISTPRVSPTRRHSLSRPLGAVVLTADFSISAVSSMTALPTSGSAHNIYFGTTAEDQPNEAATGISNATSPTTAPSLPPRNRHRRSRQSRQPDLHRSDPRLRSLQFYPPAPSKPLPRARPGHWFLRRLNRRHRRTRQHLQPARTDLTLPPTSLRFSSTFSRKANRRRVLVHLRSNDVAAELESCSGTAFRESEVTIDGNPAGVAPVYPWIYTGGIDPFLWIPIPASRP